MINNKVEPRDWEVDVVYIWCDSNNPDYIKNRNFYSKQYKLNNYWSETRDHWEIVVSIKSVRKYMKFIRNIFICAPKWHRIKNIDEKKYNIKYVTNEEILGEENCPNFNSHSLELFTHKIKGLSDFFIQFNDDFFIGWEVELNRFYNFQLKKINYFYEDVLSAWKNISFTTQKIIQKLSNEKYYFWPVHFPRMFKKSDIEDIVREYELLSNNTKKNKFRNSADLQLVYLYWYYLLHNKSWEFIFSKNTAKKNIFWNIKILLQKIFSENTSSVIKQIYLQVIYKKRLFKNKKFSNIKMYSLIAIWNNYRENKKNIDYAFEKQIKFICLNDWYSTKDKELIKKIDVDNYQYFYNELLK